MARQAFTLLACIVAAALFSSVVHAQDPCAMAKDQFYSFDQVKDCVTSFAFDEQIRTTTIDTVQKTLPVFVFRDISRDSPDPYHPSRVDIDAEVERVKNTAFDNDFTFHQTLMSAFKKLNDGHTTYTPPICYQNVHLLQPLALISIFNTQSNQQQLQFGDINPAAAAVADNLVQYYQSQIGIDVRSLTGRTILQINGEPAVAHMIQFANDSVAISKDLGTRFNMALTTYWSTRMLGRMLLPDQPTVQYVYLDSDGVTEHTIDLPFAGFPRDTWSDSTQFAAACRPTTTAAANRNNERLLAPHEEDMMIASVLNRPSPSNDNELIINGEVQFYQLTGTNIGVLRIPTFGPKDNRQFALDIQRSFFEAQLRKLPKLIIDLTGNGGGEECFAYSLIKYMYPNKFPNNYLDPLFGNSDMIASELGAALASSPIAMDPETVGESVLWSPQHWRTSDGKTFTDQSWFTTNQVNYTRGAVTSAYTQYIKENYCGEFFDFFADSQMQHTYSADDLVLLTNGYCMSTCSLFTRHMQQSQLAKTIVVGGIHGEPQGISSMPGGQVYEFAELIRDIQHLQLGDEPFVPKPLPTNARFRFAIRETYSWEAGRSPHPLEYFFEGSDFRLDYSVQSASQYQQVWNDALQYFSVCADWQTRLCPTPMANGISVQKCNGTTGEYATQCMLQSCNPGYQPSDTLSSCEPCAAGYYKNSTSLDACSQCPASAKPANSHFIATNGTATTAACAYECNAGFSGAECTFGGDIELPLAGFVGILVGCAVVPALLTAFVMTCIFRYRRNKLDEETQPLNTATGRARF